MSTFKSILVILLLVLIPPLGILLMWFLTKWPRIVKILISVLFTIFVLMIVLLTWFSTSFAQPFMVSGSSMSPTLSSGQYFMADKNIYTKTSPQRGDIVVLRNPRSTDQEFVKRIVGLPGERVKVQAGKVYINGGILKEPYLSKDTSTLGEGFLAEGQTVTVPQDQYFVLGDNRQGSSDSRDFGFVPRSYLVGKYWFSY